MADFDDGSAFFGAFADDVADVCSTSAERRTDRHAPNASELQAAMSGASLSEPEKAADAKMLFVRPLSVVKLDDTAMLDQEALQARCEFAYSQRDVGTALKFAHRLHIALPSAADCHALHLGDVISRVYLLARRPQCALAVLQHVQARKHPTAELDSEWPRLLARSYLQAVSICGTHECVCPAEVSEQHTTSTWTPQQLVHAALDAYLEALVRAPRSPMLWWELCHALRRIQAPSVLIALSLSAALALVIRFFFITPFHTPASAWTDNPCNLTQIAPLLDPQFQMSKQAPQVYGPLSRIPMARLWQQLHTMRSELQRIVDTTQQVLLSPEAEQAASRCHELKHQNEVDSVAITAPFTALLKQSLCSETPRSDHVLAVGQVLMFRAWTIVSNAHSSAGDEADAELDQKFSVTNL
jgi:hypothetical protein